MEVLCRMHLFWYIDKKYSCGNKTKNNCKCTYTLLRCIVVYTFHELNMASKSSYSMGCFWLQW